MRVYKSKRVPPFTFFGTVRHFPKEFFSKKKMFCAFWALDIAPTWDVPVLFGTVPTSLLWQPRRAIELLDEIYIVTIYLYPTKFNKTQTNHDDGNSNSEVEEVVDLILLTGESFVCGNSLQLLVLHDVDVPHRAYGCDRSDYEQQCGHVDEELCQEPHQHGHQRRDHWNTGWVKKISLILKKAR